MRIETLENEAAFARLAADLICREEARTAPVIALPSGSTPLPVYAELVRRARDGEVDFSNVTVFAVDELYGIPDGHPAGNASYFRRHLDVPLRALHLFDSEAPNPEAACSRIERLIEDAGGLDLVVLGVGVNGHIAFNEPGSPFDSRARLVELETSTRESFAQHFGSIAATPRQGLTLGIAGIIAARRVLLLATGENKAGIVARALEGPVTPEVPASALQRHARLTVVLDRAAAGRLRRVRSA